MAADVRRGLATAARTVLGRRYGRRGLASRLSPLRAAGRARRLARRAFRPDLGDAGRAWLLARLRDRRRISPQPEYTQGHLGVDWRFDAESGRYTIARIVERRSRGTPTPPRRCAAPASTCRWATRSSRSTGSASRRSAAHRQLLVNQAGREVLLLVQPADGGAARRSRCAPLARRDAGALPRLGRGEPPRRPRSDGWPRRLHPHPRHGRVGYAEFHRAFLAEYERDAPDRGRALQRRRHRLRPAAREADAPAHRLQLPALGAAGAVPRSSRRAGRWSR